MTDNAAWMETDGYIAIIHLNRPAARNALDPQMLVELADCWSRVRDAAEIRVPDLHSVLMLRVGGPAGGAS